MANKGTSDPLMLIATFWNSVGRGSPDVRFTPVDEVRLLPKSVAISPGATDPKEEFIDLDKPVYLSLYGQWTKRTGYARLTKTAAGQTVDRLLWMDKSASRLAKAKETAVFAYVMEDFNESPNYFTAAGDLKGPHQMSDTNPFQIGRASCRERV